jgi:protein-L-isoaspartate O-methyltransferase
MATGDRRDLGRVFDEVLELYDRVRPTYPDDLFADLVAIAGIDDRSRVLEVGCGTGQATRSLAALGCSVTAVEPGAGLVEVARRRLATFPNVEFQNSTFGWATGPHAAIWVSYASASGSTDRKRPRTPVHHVE